MICVDYTCDKCIHEHKELKDGWLPTCDAFPDGIPYEMDSKSEEELAICNNGIGFQLKQTNDK